MQYIGARKIAFFVFFTLACTDVFSARVGGASIRLFFPVVLIYLGSQIPYLRVQKAYLLAFVAFLASLIPSIFLSLDVPRSVAYFFWVVLTGICTYLPVRLVGARLVGFGANFDRQKYADLMVYVFRPQIIISLILFAVGVHERPQFLYYEPSYFAISLCCYVSAVGYRFFSNRKTLLDFLLIGGFLLFSFSGTFFLVLALIFLMYVVERDGVKTAKYMAIAILLGLAYFALVDDINTELVRALFRGDIGLADVLLRGGNRLFRAISAFEVFSNNFMHGIGLGGFEQYSSVHDDLPGDDGRDWLSGVGQPAINIYLEVAATAGIIGLVGFLMFLRPISVWMLGKGFSSPASKALIAMLILLAFESNYLRSYFWIAIAFVWIEFNSTRPAQNKNEN